MAALTDRDQHESEVARRISKLMTRHRHEIEKIAGSPPDFSKVPTEYWGKIGREMESEIILILILIFDRASLQHSPPDGLSEFQQSRVDEIRDRWAAEKSAEFGRGYSENTRKKLDHLQQRQNESFGQLTDEHDAQKKERKFSDGLVKIFGPERAAGIAVSEITDATSMGSETVKHETGEASNDDLWRTSEKDNVCPICAPLNRQPRSVWSLKFPKGPKAHYECNCWIEYSKTADKE